jgi:hypothetical protein
MNIKYLSRELCPPCIWKFIKRIRQSFQPPPEDQLEFRGNYLSWAEAVAMCNGYAAPVILERTRAAILKVRNGEAVFERDSVIFDQPQYALPMLSALGRAALNNSGKLSVLDFGGSLGSTYFQTKSFFGRAVSIDWAVVEQPTVVECGQREFQTSELRFYHSLDEAVAQQFPDVLLLSGVLQYLPAPHGVLASMLQLGIKHVIVDRTPFLYSGRDRLTIQHVPANIYLADYPAWVFDEKKLTTVFVAGGYRCIAEFPGFDSISLRDEPAYFKGFVLEKI